ncbi:hypothetical protein PTSG_07107 [Salpingoeca rosetta]|uniref:Nuclear pore complex protein Nup85 n=1 Tax=Salpingoeca rosetta (strain ATCC 50818 / BSB-021) TaxID=946362 RepID=F2UE29_SALR5|nr:uncharacterized protein PTSG_07107 [Salpingoeca rosetta]EGD74879.1 hypothetical protein PTSG_07107 [Salpingoeca rosetta]|eukprot:XP_004992524.1 hypothetical protein PTSG_07107 [Salpingoeca rosetta]
MNAQPSTVQRTLQRDFRVTFEDLIGVVESGSISSDQLAEFSQRFQQSLRDATALTTSPNANVSEQEAQRIAAMYRCWHLCDIFFTRGDSISKMGGFVLGELLKWSAEHFAEADRHRLDLVRCKSNFDEHPSFWPAVVHLVCQGRMKEASQLLQLHSRYPRDEMVTNAVRTVEELTRRMPVYHPGTSRTEFMGKWQTWHKHVLDRTADITDPHLALIARLFKGDDDAFQTLIDKYRMHWMEVLIARILFTAPTIVLVDMHAHLQAAAERCAWVDEYDLLSVVISGDAHTVLEQARDEFGTCMFSVHLLIFLSQTNWLADGAEQDAEYYLLEYGQEFIDQHNWTGAGSYLSSRCGEEGLRRLEKKLLSVTMRTEKCATQVWRCCLQYHLNAAAAQVCRVFGQKLQREGKPVSAITWFIRGGATDELTRSLADDVLLRYARTHDAAELAVAQQFTQAAGRCQRLQFAAKYKDICDHVQSGNFAHASGAVIEILTETTLAPKWFWVHVLIDMLPLLEHDDVLFSSFDTRSLIQCLEEVELSHCRDEYMQTIAHKYMKRSRARNAEDEVEKIRMALARNLARSLLVQAPA